MYILTVFRNDRNIRIQFGKCGMSPDWIWRVIRYAFDRDEFVSFVEGDALKDRGDDETNAALDYLEEVVG